MAKFYSSDLPEYQVEPESFEFVQMEGEIADEKFQDKPIGFFKDAMLRFCRSKVSIIAFIGIVIVLLFAVFAPALSRWDYNDQDLNRINLPPKVPVLENYGILDGTRWLTNRRVDSLEDTSRYPEGSILKVINHRTVQGVEMCDIKVDYYKYSGVEDGTYFWMGTDYLGRDLWVRMWRGARVSLLIAFISVICNVCIGIVYGSIAGYYGGKVDMIMMRITEIIGAFPEIVVVTLFILFFGTGILSIILCLVVQNWIGTARMIRSQFYRYKGSEYVLAARTLGVEGHGSDLPPYPAQLHRPHHYQGHDRHSGRYLHRVLLSLHWTGDPCSGKLHWRSLIPGPEGDAAVSQPGIFPGGGDLPVNDRLQHAIQRPARRL